MKRCGSGLKVNAHTGGLLYHLAVAFLFLSDSGAIIGTGVHRSGIGIAVGGARTRVDVAEHRAARDGVVVVHRHCEKCCKRKKVMNKSRIK